MVQTSKVILERCQHDGEPDESRMCQGEAGYGLYAYIPKLGMREYYSANDEDVCRLELVDGQYVDLSKGTNLDLLVSFAKARFAETAKHMQGYQIPKVSTDNIQRFGSVIEDFVRTNYPDVAVYLVPHKGPGLPTGVQAVIRKLDAFEITPLENAGAAPVDVKPAQRGLGW